MSRDMRDLSPGTYVVNPDTLSAEFIAAFARLGLRVRSVFAAWAAAFVASRLGRFGFASRLPGPPFRTAPELGFRPFGPEASPPIGLSGAQHFGPTEAHVFPARSGGIPPNWGMGVKFCERSQADLGNGRKSSPCGRDLGRFVQFQRRGRRVWAARMRAAAVTAGPAIRPALRCAITRGQWTADGVYKLHNCSAEASVPLR
jgi:hypothetical protein